MAHANVQNFTEKNIVASFIYKKNLPRYLLCHFTLFKTNYIKLYKI